MIKHLNAYSKALLSKSSQAGKRFDQILADSFPDFSRSQLQKWLKKGAILVDNKIVPGKQKLVGGEKINLNIELESQTEWSPENIPLNIIYEDEHIIIINKPVNMVVHPGAGNNTGTLSNALLYHFPEIKNVPRAGIVHRLDKDTSGLLIVAKTIKAHTSLVEQLQERSVHREYEAITTGVITSGSTINKPIGRNPHHRTKMAVVDDGKNAITTFKVIEKYRAHSRIRCKLETGRTHQIRVHMQSINAPLLGDQTYNLRLRIPNGATNELVQQLRTFKRQALHAYKLGVIHPETGEKLYFTAQPPNDMQLLIKTLRNDVQTLYRYDDEDEDFEWDNEW